MDHSTTSADLSVGEVLHALALADLAITRLGSNPLADRLRQLRMDLLQANVSEVLSPLSELLSAVNDVAPHMQQEQQDQSPLPRRIGFRD